MTYTMSDKARQARAKGGHNGKGKTKNVSEEQKERLRARAAAMKLPPRVRVMVDKELYDYTTKLFGTLDKGLKKLKEVCPDFGEY